MWIIENQKGIDEINEALNDAIGLVATQASYSRSTAIRPVLKQVVQALVGINELMAETIVWDGTSRDV